MGSSSFLDRGAGVSTVDGETGIRLSVWERSTMAIDLSAVTLTELRYAVAVADHRHFGRAAAACFVTQPTLSAQVQKLERSLGVRLFERSSQAVHATPEGEEI